MLRTTQPALHADQHLPWGSDPIPGLVTEPAGGVGFADRIAEINTDHGGNHLIGYWRLGEASSPFADTSGQSPAAPAAHDGTTPAMTDSITGALPAADDDGAVQFNQTTGAAQQHLYAAEPAGGPYRFQLINDLTVTAWVKPAASASSFNGQAVGNWFVATG